MSKNQSKRNSLHLGRIIALASVIIILIGAGIFVLPQLGGGPSSDPANPKETIVSDPTDASDQDGLRTLAETTDGSYRLYVTPGSNGNGGYSQVYIENENGEVRIFNWELNEYSSAFPPTLQLSDLNNDEVDELVVVLNIPNSSGVFSQELHVLHSKDMTEIPVPSAGQYLDQSVESQVLPLNGYVWIRLNVNGQIYEKAVDSKKLEAWGDKIDFHHSIKYTVRDRPDLTYATVDAFVGAGTGKMKFGTMDVNYTFTEKGFVLDPLHFQVEEEIAGEIPLLAIQAGGKYIALRDYDNEVDLTALLGEPLTELTKQLGSDAGTFNGMYTKSLTYEGLELTLYSAKGDKYYLVNMRVTDERYATSLGIRVGDTAQQVEEVYPFVELAKDGRTPPHNFAYALSNDFYSNLYLDIKDGIVNEIYFEYLID